MIFDDVFLIFGYFEVLFKDVSLKICLICGIELNILLVFVVMDIVIEVCLVIVMV